MTDNPKELGVPLLITIESESSTGNNKDIPAPDESSQNASTGQAVTTQVSEDSNAPDNTVTVDLTAPPLPVSVHRSEGYLIEDKQRTPSATDSEKGKTSVAKRGHRRSRSDGFENPNILLNGHAVQTNGGLQLSDRKPSRTVSQGGLRHRICIEEIVPSHSSYLGDHKEENEIPDEDWKADLDHFTSKKHDKSDKKLPRRIKRYYKMQDELITAFENLQLDLDDAMENAEQELKAKRWAVILAKVSFFCNLLLLIGKSVAAGMSGSLAVISSVIDSAVDLVSGALMWWSNRAVKNRNIYEYPQGRTKLEPVAIVILSVVMSLASVQMIRESIEKIIYYTTIEEADGPKFEIPTIVICALTVVIKFILWLVCRRVKNPSVQALSQDHRNDVLSNSIAIACGLLGDKVWPYADPIGAIVISLYIIGSWFLTGWEQIKMLTGVTARPEFLKKITWIALNHHSSIMLIDTVRAFHFGSNFLVEVDIVLPPEMSLQESHDIGETLQLKIERLPEVERAFVHLDYETDHSPFSEHKQV